MKPTSKKMGCQTSLSLTHYYYFWFSKVLLSLLLALAFSACTVVTVEEATRIAEGGAFDAISYVQTTWPQVTSTIVEQGIELSAVLGAIQPDSQGLAPKENLQKVADEFGLTTVGGAHVFMVRGQGQVTAVDTSSRSGTIEVALENYNGPVKVKIFIGPRLPSDETAVRDAVGFIQFGDFKEQTEFGKVARELNKRVLSDVLANLDAANLLGKKLFFNGAFTIRAFNQPGGIDVKEILLTPVQIEIAE